MSGTSRVDEYWRSYVSSLPRTERAPKSYEIWRFGDTEELANKIGPLVQSGKKTATSDLLWELEPAGRRLPEAGDIGIVTNSEGDPLCIVEVTEVEIKSFNEVDERFVLDYGEGEQSLDWWRTAMWAYYSDVCRRIRREPAKDMPIVCQRFRLLYDK